MGSYATFAPNGLARFTGLAQATVGGQLMIVVLQIGAAWLWPASNTGPFNRTTGTCCANPAAGACCFANSNQPAATPRGNTTFLYAATVPAAPSCSYAGYYCPSGTPVQCPAGSSCAGGVITACARGAYSAAGWSACVACPAGLSTASTGAASAALCLPCAANFVPAAGAGCVACAQGLTAAPGSSTCSNPNAGAFTPGNLLVFMAGDGTVPGSALPSATGANDRNSVNTVAGKIVEYSVGAGGALAATGVSAVLPSTGTAAPPSGPITVLGNVADVGNSGGTYQPFSGHLDTSTDGTIVSFVGYSTPAGTFVGASCMCNNIAALASNNNVGMGVNVTASTVQRVIGWFDASGQVRIVNGNLNAAFGSLPVYSALWYNGGAGQSGFWVTGGYTITSLQLGGIYWVPMPYGIGGPMGTVTLICANPAYTANNYKMYSSVYAFGGWLYALRVTAGTSGGGGSLPVAFPTTTQASCSAGGTLSQIPGGGTNNAQTMGGWAIHAMVWTTNSTGGAVYWHVDGELGLTRMTGCVGQPLRCSGYTAAAGAYQTAPPLALVGGNAFAIGFISGINVTVDGLQMIMLNTISGVWLWPVNNSRVPAGRPTSHPPARPPVPPR